MLNNNNLMVDLKDLIIRLKEIRQEKGLSYGDIGDLMEANGDFVSKSTIARVFAEGSEEVSFRYEETIRPIAKALLDIETIEETDNMDVQAMKSLLKYKMKVIEDLERQCRDMKAAWNEDKLAALEKLESERESWSRSIEFLKEQVSYKDKRIDFLLDSVKDKDDMLKNCMCCAHRTIKEGE